MIYAISVAATTYVHLKFVRSVCVSHITIIVFIIIIIILHIIVSWRLDFRLLCRRRLRRRVSWRLRHRFTLYNNNTIHNNNIIAVRSVVKRRLNIINYNKIFVFQLDGTKSCITFTSIKTIERYNMQYVKWFLAHYVTRSKNWYQREAKTVYVVYAYIIALLYMCTAKVIIILNKKNEVDQNKRGNTPEARADLLWVTDTRIFTRFHNRFMWLRL